jgi:hypothetical protein
MVVHYVEREREEWSRLLRKSPGCGYRVGGGWCERMSAGVLGPHFMWCRRRAKGKGRWRVPSFVKHQQLVEVRNFGKGHSKKGTEKGFLRFFPETPCRATSFASSFLWATSKHDLLFSSTSILFVSSVFLGALGGRLRERAGRPCCCSGRPPA